MLLVQLGINSTRDVWKFAKILAKFPNVTRTINPELYSSSHDYLYLLTGVYPNTPCQFALLTRVPGENP